MRRAAQKQINSTRALCYWQSPSHCAPPSSHKGYIKRGRAVSPFPKRSILGFNCTASQKGSRGRSTFQIMPKFVNRGPSPRTQLVHRHQRVVQRRGQRGRAITAMVMLMLILMMAVRVWLHPLIEPGQPCFLFVLALSEEPEAAA